MKRIFLAFFFLMVTTNLFANSLTHNPMYPYICINNASPYNVQIFVDRSPMIVAGRYTSVLYSNSFQSLLIQINTRQFIPRNPIWASQEAYPTNVGCTLDNTVSIGMTNANILFLN